MQDEMAQRPHKRTGVWLNETMKYVNTTLSFFSFQPTGLLYHYFIFIFRQKVPSESNLKRYSRDSKFLI